MSNSNRSNMVQMGITRCDCSGCGACVEICPELFAWDDAAEQVDLLQEKADPEEVARAMAYCPNDCIEIEEC